MMYKIYYKIVEVDLEYRYATTVEKELLETAVLECFEGIEVNLLIIESNRKQNMDNPIPIFSGTNQQYLESLEHRKVKC